MPKIDPNRSFYQTFPRQELVELSNFCPVSRWGWGWHKKFGAAWDRGLGAWVYYPLFKAAA